jgi:hypothetical protein
MPAAPPFPALLRMRSAPLPKAWQFVRTISHLQSVRQNMFDLVFSFDPTKPDTDRTSLKSDGSRTLSSKGTRCFTQTADVHRAARIGYRLAFKNLS